MRLVHLLMWSQFTLLRFHCTLFSLLVLDLRPRLTILHLATVATVPMPLRQGVNKLRLCGTHLHLALGVRMLLLITLSACAVRLQ